MELQSTQPQQAVFVAVESSCSKCITDASRPPNIAYVSIRQVQQHTDASYPTKKGKRNGTHHRLTNLSAKFHLAFLHTRESTEKKMQMQTKKSVVLCAHTSAHVSNTRIAALVHDSRVSSEILKYDLKRFAGPPPLAWRLGDTSRDATVGYMQHET